VPWWRGLLRRKSAEERLESELMHHIDELTRENLRAGMTPEEAERRARIDFGGTEQIKEELRDVHRMPLWDGARENLKAGLRFLRKSPSFSLTVILTMGLGIGANSAVFSAIDAILLRPLPFPESDRLMKLSQFNAKVANPETAVAPVRLEDWNRLNSTFEALTGYYVEDISEISGTLPEKINQAWVAPRFLQVWGIGPALGRDFSEPEHRFGGPTAVLMSDRLWRRRFGGDPGAVGKKLRTSNGSLTIVGIMPASFHFSNRETDLWSPIPVDSPYARSRESTWYTVIGRLKPGMMPAQARANLDTVQAQLGKQFPKTDADLHVKMERLKETAVGGVRSSLWLLFGSVSLLLLIACTNIVGLLLARSSRRQHEISVRFSLGASRTAVVTQLLSEAFVLALAGSVLGLVIAAGSAGIFRALARDLPRVEEIRLDGRIVLYALACAVLATLACGLFPAMRGTRKGLSDSLARTGRTQVSARGRLPWLLVGAQVALAVTLLAGAGLLVRSFQELGRVSPGFDSRRVLTFHLSASWGETADMKGLTRRVDRTLEALRALPGVEAAATAGALPGVPAGYRMEVQLTDGPADPGAGLAAETRFVSPDYFAALGIPLVAGQRCREEGGSASVMVNHSFARAYLPGTTAAGHHLRMIGNAHLPAGEIRGIVGDAREEGLDREPGPAIYWCMSAPVPDPYYLVRTRGEPMAMAETVRRKMAEIEPGRSVFGLLPLEGHLAESFAENRLRTVLLAFFALTAVALACIGLYGTLSYGVSLRRREVGLRLALGAQRAEIARGFLMQGLGISLLGSLAGWVLARGFARALSGMLYGVAPTDAATLGGVVTLMMLVAAAASLIPAIRAARVEPMQVLRDE
jgi:putative ABC transport system permease protein